MQSPLEKAIQGNAFKDSDGFYDSEVAKIKLDFLVANRLRFISQDCWDSCVRIKGSLPDLHPGEIVCIERCVEKHNAVYDIVSQQLKMKQQQQQQQAVSIAVQPSFSLQLEQQQQQQQQQQ